MNVIKIYWIGKKQKDDYLNLEKIQSSKQLQEIADFFENTPPPLP